MLRPTGAGVLTLAGLAVLVSATGYAISAIAVRVLGRSDSTQSMVFWMLLMTSVFAIALAWRDWVPIHAEHWRVIAVLGVTGAIGQYALTDAFRRAAASRIAPLEYTALIWGIILDRVLWNTLPDAITLTGAAVIIASGCTCCAASAITAKPSIRRAVGLGPTRPRKVARLRSLVSR